MNPTHPAVDALRNRIGQRLRAAEDRADAEHAAANATYWSRVESIAAGTAKDSDAAAAELERAMNVLDLTLQDIEDDVASVTALNNFAAEADVDAAKQRRAAANAAFADAQPRIAALRKQADELEAAVERERGMAADHLQDTHEAARHFREMQSALRERGYGAGPSLRQIARQLQQAN